MKIRYDACKGKQVRFSAAVAKRLRALGTRCRISHKKHCISLTRAEDSKH